MRNLFSIATIAVVVLGAAGAAADELPTYELMGFPITPHQFSVVGSANIQERAPTPGLGLTLGGMPASPHQLAVLMPRTRTEATAKLATIGVSAR